MLQSRLAAAIKKNRCEMVGQQPSSGFQDQSGIGPDGLSIRIESPPGHPAQDPERYSGRPGCLLAGRTLKSAAKHSALAEGTRCLIGSDSHSEAGLRAALQQASS